jgi:Flp pilus assembly CpaF family ATPase
VPLTRSPQSFGVTPPVLVEHQSIIRGANEALQDGVGSPGRAMLITGARGTGKTVTLNAIKDLARARRWAVITEDSRPGLLERLYSSNKRPHSTPANQ